MATVKPFEITEDLYHELREESGGYCLSCRQEAYGIEPDAREYTCEACGESRVYGIDEVLIVGLIDFVEGE